MSDQVSYFPLFIDISDKKIAVIGGGSIATRRVRTLADFGAKITMISPDITESIAQMVQTGIVSYKKDHYKKEYIRNADIVLACSDKPQINHMVFDDCKELGILVNNCSDKQECDFYFPGVVKREHVVVGVTASGNDHKLTKKIREQIEDMI